MGEVISTNKKAYRDFFIIESYECGIELKGAEVKSIRSGHVNFKDAFARMEREEVFLYNLHINPYEQASYMNQEPDRTRKLLLHKKQIKKLFGAVSQKGLALIPTKIYFNQRGFVKVELAVARGKKLYDKREAIKKRSIERGLQIALKQRKK